MINPGFWLLSERLPASERLPLLLNDYPCTVNDLSATKQMKTRKRTANTTRKGCPLHLQKTPKAFEIKDFGKKIPPRQFYQNYRGDMVRVVGLKPTSLAVPNRAFYQLNYTRIFDFCPL